MEARTNKGPEENETAFLYFHISISDLLPLISGKQNITVWPLHSLVSIIMKTRLCNLLQQKLKSIAKPLDKTL